MTDNELNALVAEKVMGIGGIRLYTGREDIYPFHIAGGGLTVDSLMYEKEDWLLAELPDYCNDIAAAWQVVEKMFMIVSGPAVTPGENDYQKWRASIMKRSLIDNGNSPGQWHYASTAPRAICLAALKAVGVEVE